MSSAFAQSETALQLTWVLGAGIARLAEATTRLTATGMVVDWMKDDFPRILGVLMIVLGAILTLRALRVRGEREVRRLRAVERERAAARPERAQGLQCTANRHAADVLTLGCVSRALRSRSG